MTNTLKRPINVLTLATLIALALTSAGALEAQGGPPAARAPRDSQPAVRALVSPSRPPSTVAPRAPLRPAQVRVATDSAPRVPKSPGMPVDSARPAPAPLNALDPRRAPPEQPAPPAPTARRPAIVEQRAAALSDSPPIGATARCRDGTFLLSRVDENACVGNGGLAVVFPQRQTPKPPQP